MSFDDKEPDTDPAAPQAMTPPPEGSPKIDPVLLAHVRWSMKALELMRRIAEAGYDVDAELTRLQNVYEKRRNTATLRLPVTELPPPDQNDPRREED
jgi:hypothetical protein